MNIKNKHHHRVMRHHRARAKIKGTAERPRVAVFRSNRHIFVQVIDDSAGKTLMSNEVKSLKATKKAAPKGNKTTMAGNVGQIIAEKMKAAGFREAVFDRGGFKYHGRIKAVAEALRAGGIKI